MISTFRRLMRRYRRKSQDPVKASESSIRAVLKRLRDEEKRIFGYIEINRAKHSITYSIVIRANKKPVKVQFMRTIRRGLPVEFAYFHQVFLSSPIPDNIAYRILNAIVEAREKGWRHEDMFFEAMRALVSSGHSEIADAFLASDHDDKRGHDIRIVTYFDDRRFEVPVNVKSSRAAQKHHVERYGNKYASVRVYDKNSPRTLQAKGLRIVRGYVRGKILHL
ncbi:hypothetical protein HY967_04675 [Candidatus Jorgensenbacteria bacterium]|nr:hypothetical protein [Candidatus Jorgensenbacteria bacterium]